MAKPTTKSELIISANGMFEKLWQIIDGMSESMQNAEFCFHVEKKVEQHWKRDKNLRDVLVHLSEWHKLLIEWESSNSSGTSKPFLPPPYTWKTYGEMNVEFWQKHQNTSLDDAKKMLKTSHNQVLEVIEKYNDEELFTKKYFNWTGTSSLGQYCISTTASHYDWAIKKLKEQLKATK